MRKGKKTAVSLALIMVMVLTIVMAGGTVSYAAGPEIVSEVYDMWAFPGEPVTVGVTLNEKADQVHMEIYNDGSWTTCLTLQYIDPQKTAWANDMTPPYGNTGICSYIFRFEITYNDGMSTKYSNSFTINWNYDQGYERLWGDNRYQTAFRTADEMRSMLPAEKYPNVIIASGLDFADALGGTYLAAQKHAPILLVNSKSPQIIQDVAGEIQKNLYEGGMIYILGGCGAVSEEMESALKAGGMTNIMRFAGKNRYDTNLQILNYLGPVGGDVLVCCASDFADALSASATGKPILLVGNTLLEEHLQFFNNSVPDRVYIIGGTGAVSQKVEDLLNDFGIPEVFRIYGQNRYQTSAAVAGQFFTNKQRRYVTFAYGLDFPDGLSGGPLSYEIGAPLLLVKEGADLQSVCDVVQQGVRARRAKILGGPSLIPNSLVEKILDIKGQG